MPVPQPVASIEPTPPAIAAPAGSVVTSDAVSATSAVEAGAIAEKKLRSPLVQLAQAESVPTSWLWMNKHDQLFVGVFAAVFLALSGYHWATLGGWGMRPIELDRLPARQYDFRIDINSASWVEWTQIEGIGESTAQKIIADHETNGPFRNVKDLLRVKGIGPKTLEKMQPFLRETIDKTSEDTTAP
ncbi:MAG: helix-hairpin-helix domain-containing protein [Planctomycetota bacterium]|nr:MAG: helix-hairpin-helix domain-containing protein [Planctomycetota bacterium]